jgi:hypothetical protein
MSNAYNKFLDMLKSSVITQAAVTFCLVVTCCVLWVRNAAVPADLYQLTVLVVGFWFGSKIGYAQGQTDQIAKQATPDSLPPA